MTKEEIMQYLEENELEEIIELIEDAEAGELTQLEIVPSIGLLYDLDMNEKVLNMLRELGVHIIYITDDE